MTDGPIPAIDRLSKHAPLYVSKRSLKNLWQQYRIYPDRIELQSWIVFQTLKIPFDEITDIVVRRLFSTRRLLGGLRRFLGLKLDLADLCRHITITKDRGIVRCVVFTPDDPDQFAGIMKLLQEKAGQIGSLLEK
jgi:hypothetical protein